MQYVDVGHKKHLEHCSGSRKRQQEATLGHVEIEGLDELEAEEERMHDDEEEAQGTSRPAKVCQQLTDMHKSLCCSRTRYRTHLLPLTVLQQGPLARHYSLALFLHTMHERSQQYQYTVHCWSACVLLQ